MNRNYRGAIKFWIAAVQVVTSIMAVPAAAFDPVNVEGNGATLRLSVLGTYRGGMFSKESPTYPVYDSVTERLFIGSVDRLKLDVLDISEPNAPVPILTNEFNLSSWDGPNRIAISEGLIAVATEASKVVFFNPDGIQLADPVDIPGAAELAFTRDGQKLVVTVIGTDVDPGYLNDSAVVILDLSSADRNACRLGDLSNCNLNPTVSTVSFDGFNSQRDQLLADGVRLPFTGAPFNRTVAQDLEPAAVTVSDSDTAWITLIDNNAIMEVDLQLAQVANIFGLGVKDNNLPDNGFPDADNSLPAGLPGNGMRGNGFDASDKDGGINIQTWPIKTFYEPDGIGTYSAGGQTFLVTANEGDPRTAISGFETSARLEDLSSLPVPVLLDPLNPASDLQDQDELGRLKVSTVDGDTDGDGELEELFAFGARSFSIWSDSGQLVFDSGDDFEKITAAVLPNHFNAAEDENAADKRSDDRGPEPEGLDIGTIGERSYVFVTFERIGGIIAYDITDPNAVHFEQYINNRNFDVEPKDVCGQKGGPADPNCHLAGDLEPEGVLFIPADQSPIGVPLIAVSHELSDSTTLYRVDVIPEPSMLALTAIGLLVLVGYAWQRRKETN